MTEEQAVPETPPTPLVEYEDPDDNLSFCGFLIAGLALLLLIAAGVVAFSTDAEFEIPETYYEASTESSGIGGDNTVDNTWD